MSPISKVAYFGIIAVAAFFVFWYPQFSTVIYQSEESDKHIPLPELDKRDYNARMLALAGVNTSTETVSTESMSVRVISTTTPSIWPPSTVYPNVGAILPFNRIIAYYGNFYSKRMGVLGEYPEEEMLAMLASTTEMWTRADPNTPAIGAIHYIAVVAQTTAGREGKYILRMPDDQIDYAIELARKINGIVFLDVQVGLSTLEHELPKLEKYLKMPQVHLGVDPEFSMKKGERPGTVIGTFDAADINFAAEYLAKLVRENNLPPKILVIHRFTRNMLTNHDLIKPLPEVQIVIHMDGFGSKEQKRATYTRVVVQEPVQFAGIKIFYKNDMRPPSTGLLTPYEMLNLRPIPIYIQYQ